MDLSGLGRALLGLALVLGIETSILISIVLTILLNLLFRR
jgi:hypothetical protein